jgi:nickel-dependent lactate racemase
MRVDLAYGKQRLALELPDEWNVTVIEPQFVPGLPDPQGALREALQHPIGAQPLAEVVRPGDQVGIVFSDITRATPHGLILPAVLETLRDVPPARIVLCCALGTHRPNTDDELRQMFAMGAQATTMGTASGREAPAAAEAAAELLRRYRVVQNDAFDPATQVRLGGTVRGHEIWLNREIAACDVKVLTGFIEPHFFAGFSGGGKALMPGMAGLRTVLGNHDAQMIAHPQATWGVTAGNPIYEEVMEVAQAAGGVFLVNVTLNKDKALTGVFAGELAAAHAAGCEFVRETAMAPVPEAFDIVITSNSGYPLDLNLYQAVKGMSAAAQVVRPGGAIICVAECWDGIPEHGRYGQLLREAQSPGELLRRITRPGFLEQDQWQAQIQAQIQAKAQVYVYSDYLSDVQIGEALLQPCRDILGMVGRLREEVGGRICVLPEGPQTIPYISGG